MYIERTAAKHTLERYLNHFPIVGLTGPRQSGKSTLLQQSLADYRYLSFDDQKNVAFFEDDPDAFMQQYHDKVIFDEVQYVPKLFHAIKSIVDKNREEYGQFILTGSSQFSFLKNISESLAGRIGLISLLPFQYSEMPKALLESSIFSGSYPELVTRSYRESSLWYSAYIETYLMKDIYLLMEISNRRDFKRLIKLLAANIAQPLEMSYYAKNVGVSVPTIKRWLSVLEATYIIFFLPPYYNNFNKRIVKSPKLYFYDTGLVSHLTGITTQALYENGPLAGPLYENYIISEVFKKILHRADQADCYYLRTQDKAEIDLIIERANQTEYIEIKKTSTYRPKMASAIKRYASQHDRKLVLYQGARLQMGDIEVMPYHDYLTSE